MANSLTNLPVRVPKEIRAVSKPLHDYLQRQADLLRTEAKDSKLGQSTVPIDILTQVTSTPLFTLGAVAQFNHATYGLITGQYVLFAAMAAGGGPCGFVSGSSPSEFQVTNDFAESSPSLAAGFLPATTTITSGNYGWVVTKGVNLTAIPIAGGETSTLGAEVYWTDTNEVSPNAAGVVIGQQRSAEAIDATYAIGTISISLGSSAGYSGQQAITTRVDSLNAAVQDNVSSVETLTQTVADESSANATAVDGLQTSVAETNSVVSQANIARARGDSALAARVVKVTASIDTAVSAAVSTETNARVEADSAMAERIDQVSTSFGVATATLAEAQAGLLSEVDSQASATNALVETTDALSSRISSRASGSKENLLAEPNAGAESSGNGTNIKSIQLVLADAGVPAGETLSFSGFVKGDEIDRIGLEIIFKDVGGSTISQSPIGGETDGVDYQYIELVGVIIPALCTDIVCKAVRIPNGGGATFYAKQFMLVVGDSASRYPYTTANARATSVLSARVTVNEGDITAHAGLITTLEATVDNPTSGVVANASAIVTAEANIIVNDGLLTTLNAQYSVKLDVNGRVAGFGLAATANEAGEVDTSAVFTVDSFKVYNNVDANGVAPFIIENNIVTVTELSASRLRANTAIVDDIYIGGSLVALKGAYQGSAKGALVVNDGTRDMLMVGYLSPTEIGMRLLDVAGATVFDSTTTVAADVTNADQQWADIGGSPNAGINMILDPSFKKAGDGNADVWANRARASIVAAPAQHKNEYVMQLVPTSGLNCIANNGNGTGAIGVEYPAKNGSVFHYKIAFSHDGSVNSDKDLRVAIIGRDAAGTNKQWRYATFDQADYTADTEYELEGTIELTHADVASMYIRLEIQSGGTTGGNWYVSYLYLDRVADGADNTATNNNWSEVADDDGNLPEGGAQTNRPTFGIRAGYRSTGAVNTTYITLISFDVNLNPVHTDSLAKITSGDVTKVARGGAVGEDTQGDSTPEGTYYVAYDFTQAGRFVFSGGGKDIAIVKRAAGTWQYWQAGTVDAWTPFTPDANYILIGEATKDGGVWSTNSYSQGIQLTAAPEIGASVGDLIGMTENLLGIDAGPVQGSGHFYWDAVLLADYGLAIGDVLSLSGLVSCTDAAATNVRVYFYFREADDSAVQQVNGTLIDGLSTDVLSIAENVTIPPLSAKLDIVIGRSTGDHAQISARKVMLNRGPVANPFTNRVIDGQGVMATAVNIPSSFNMDQGGGVLRTIPRALLSGTAYHGSALTFDRNFATPPVIHYGGGGLTSSASLSGAVFQDYKNSALSVSGFTPSLLLKEAVGTPATATTTSNAVNTGTQDWELENNSGQSPAWDDWYTYSVDVSITPDGYFDVGAKQWVWTQGWVAVELFIWTGVWTSIGVATIYGDVNPVNGDPETVNGNVLVRQGAGLISRSGAEFGASYSSSAAGGSVLDLNSVAFDYIAAPASISATAGTTGIPFWVLEGDE